MHIPFSDAFPPAPAEAEAEALALAVALDPSPPALAAAEASALAVPSPVAWALAAAVASALAARARGRERQLAGSSSSSCQRDRSVSRSLLDREIGGYACSYVFAMKCTTASRCGAARMGLAMSNCPQPQTHPRGLQPLANMQETAGVRLHCTLTRFSTADSNNDAKHQRDSADAA